jgi:hypothetical protein
VESPEHQAEAVARYFLIESPEGTEIRHLERLASTRVLGRAHDTWDVHASDGRWWVITEPTNLYSQDDFPSADLALTFHIGLSARVASRSHVNEPHDSAGLLPESWRRFRRVVDSMEAADEAEDFQTVGVRCREALLALVREAATDDMVPAGLAPPKRADFLHWSEHLAGHLAAGSSAERMRSYLKSTAKQTWEYVGWLTHAQNANRYDAEFAVDATSAVRGVRLGAGDVRADRARRLEAL